MIVSWVDISLIVARMCRFLCHPRGGIVGWADSLILKVHSIKTVLRLLHCPVPTRKEDSEE